MKLVSGCISPTSSELLMLLIIIDGDNWSERSNERLLVHGRGLFP